MSSGYDDELGVGGRQGLGVPSQGGGGGLDCCTKSKFSLKDDPRFRDLERIGLNADWLGLAKSIGFDDFLVVWQFLSARRDEHRRFTVPDYNGYERYQRNCYIRALLTKGVDVKEIRKIVAKVLDEHLSERTIKRAIK